MIVAIVTFRYPDGAYDPDRFTEQSRRRRIFYEGLPGLILKIYWGAPDAPEAGGIYLWESLEQARATYNEEWQRRAAEAFGVAPEIRYLNVSDTIQNGPIPPLP